MKLIFMIGLLALSVRRGLCKSLVLVGGGLDEANGDVWNKVIELAGGVGVARFGVVCAASGDPPDSAAYYIDLLKQYGAASADWIQIDESRKENNEDPATIDLILSQTGFFFSGGDQARVITSFYHFPERIESSALAAIRQVYNAGGLIAGSSAGTACQSANVMINGGLSYEALRYGASSGGYNPNYPDDLSYDEFGGIGMVSGMVLDSHFSTRGREGRLIRLVADTMTGPLGTSLGVGVDEDTALVIYNVGETSQLGEVLGTDGVLFLDLSKSTVSTIGGEWAISNVKSSYLTEGDTYSFNGNKVIGEIFG
ncbi:cyanophycinase-like [Amphiura filiformis]|uniref:cyanophycinase-like n=1 Tax=Amphiura filiformis TaxID=82378 RepID=UPI003B22565C